MDTTMELDELKQAWQTLDRHLERQHDIQWQLLRDRKLETLAAREAPLIVSGNIGCIQHLQSGTPTPVRHWIEVIDELLAS